MDPDDAPADHLRLVALEERLMHQQRLIDELNEVVLEHERRLDQHSRELASQLAAVARLAEHSRGDDLPYEKPPHY